MFLNFPRAKVRVVLTKKKKKVRVVGLACIVWRGFFIREPGGGEVTMDPHVSFFRFMYVFLRHYHCIEVKTCIQLF